MISIYVFICCLLSFLIGAFVGRYPLVNYIHKMHIVLEEVNDTIEQLNAQFRNNKEG